MTGVPDIATILGLCGWLPPGRGRRCPGAMLARRWAAVKLLRRFRGMSYPECARALGYAWHGDLARRQAGPYGRRIAAQALARWRQIGQREQSDRIALALKLRKEMAA